MLWPLLVPRLLPQLQTGQAGASWASAASAPFQPTLSESEGPGVRRGVGETGQQLVSLPCVQRPAGLPTLFCPRPPLGLRGPPRSCPPRGLPLKRLREEQSLGAHQP